MDHIDAQIDALAAEFGQQHRNVIASALDAIQTKDPLWIHKNFTNPRAYIADAIHAANAPKG
jgi:hypothetical protein